MSKARRVEIVLEFSGMDVSEDVVHRLTNRLLTASYTDNEEDCADDIQLTYDDRERNLNGAWLEVKPTVIQTETQVKREVQQKEEINYIVKKGDTLWNIASKYLGDGKKYKQIAQENGVKNPNLIYPGQVFRILVGGAIVKTVTQTKKATERVAKTKLVKVKLIQHNWEETGRKAVLDCGTFELDSVELTGPPMIGEIKGTSIPHTSAMRMQKKSRSWEQATLRTIANQIASEAGMKLLYECSDTPKYDKKEQVQQLDIRFLQELCHAEGKALKVTKMAVVVFDKEEYDKKPVVKTIRYGGEDVLSFRLSTKLKDAAYTSCHVSYTNTEKQQTIEYTYTPDSSQGTGQVLEINERVANTEEAKRIAKKRLREKNAQEFTGNFTMVGNVGLVAGIVVKLQGFQHFDKKYRVKSARHTLTGGYKTEIELVQVLEGY